MCIIRGRGQRCPVEAGEAQTSAIEPCVGRSAYFYPYTKRVEKVGTLLSHSFQRASDTLIWHPYLDAAKHHSNALVDSVADVVGSNLSNLL